MQMTRQSEDEEREERIHMEIIVDAYGPEEQAMGWYYYLADTMNFRFLPGVLFIARPRHWNREIR
jgi:Calcium binding